MTESIHAATTAAPSPADLALALEGVAALADLLICVDEQRWASLARPSARGLGALIGASLAQVDLAQDRTAA